ncbi:MAG: GxxExxY protein [Candidatus Omnitrophica bacterium CG11_big_fil_rev_8_21_14_0_20_42_13]|uniref:GxxExxY protein n=1 Tax=Candidatus Ghiorseimicrobium undicola TaxID=1974746 RepID=A0A2H0LYK0_9BACT|nr:MAG: GxxExxY protein [Candidatus Omnitrophica bacterium CG11_big_fil_rev_8_21_14_0_20_42_13]
MITQIKHNDTLTEKIIGCCYKVHTELGPGFSEKIYHNALKLALGQTNLKYNTEKRYNVYYQNKKVGSLILDLVIEDKIIVEIKSIAGYVPAVFNYQILSYLRASGLKIGLLINFGNKSCQVKRFIN